MTARLVTPYCPECGRGPAFAVSAQQAFCGNDACATFCWDMTMSLADLTASTTVLDLTGLDEALAVYETAELERLYADEDADKDQGPSTG